jgi:hypothetical protein
MKTSIVSTLLLFLCSSAFAADATGDRWHISILASEISSGRSVPSDDAHAGAGIGVAYRLTPQWDVELAAATQSHRSQYTKLFYVPLPGAPGEILPVTEYREYRVAPVELAVTRHFLSDGPIAPYVRAGVRYVNAPHDGPRNTFITFTPGTSVPQQPIAVSEGFHFADRTSAQVGAGVRVRLTPRTAIRAEANRLVRSDEVDFDRLTRFAVGLSWIF